MPAADSEILIVARYLKSNSYTESYDAFVREAGLPEDAGNVSKGDLTLETLLEEKKNFDISVKFEKLGVEDTSTAWTKPSPANAHEVDVLPTASNILSARIDSLKIDEGPSLRTLFASTADRKFHSLDSRTNALRNSVSNLHDSPVLSSAVLNGEHILTASMSGQLQLSNLQGQVIEKRQDHSKYIVKVAILEDDPNEILVATAGWDSKVQIYRVSTSETRIGEPKVTIPLSTKPEAIAFLRHPENNNPIILVSRTDSSFLFFYTLEDEPRLLGKQNLAPHSNAWVAFTPSAFELCPTDSTLLAVGTSSVPHMKLLLVKLLFPPWDPTPAPEPPRSTRASLLGDEQVGETQASQARAALAIADKESAAIKIHCTTMAPQTAYSTPTVAWRPNGSGVWVNGDDGAVRGVEASTGKIVSTLKGHEPGSKVRCLWAGMIDGEQGDEKEVLVSGGFDHRLIVWNV